MQYNPNAPEVKADPYPYYAELRRDHPVCEIESVGAYAVSRYDDVARVLMEPKTFSSTGFGNTEVNGRRTNMMIGTDPPDHTRLRNLVNRAFTPRMVDDLAPRIQEITNRLIDRAAPRGEFDVIADLAVPLPVTIIAEILGVDPDRHDDFKRWSTAAISGDGFDDQEERQRLMEAFIAYFQEIIERRRRAPKDDLISALVRAEEQEKALTSDELVAFTLLLLIAGNETTTNLIGNGVLALVEHPEQLAKVLDDRSLIPNLVEEALRYDSPVQFLFRKTMADVEIGGSPIPIDSIVLPLYGSANRDERRFPEPDRFDVTRDARGHLAFGHGIHFCLGAPLARLEGKIALEAVVTRLPDLAREDAELERVPSPFLRGLRRLPVSFTPRSPEGSA